MLKAHKKLIIALVTVLLIVLGGVAYYIRWKAMNVKEPSLSLPDGGIRGVAKVQDLTDKQKLACTLTSAKDIKHITGLTVGSKTVIDLQTAGQNDHDYSVAGCNLDVLYQSKAPDSTGSTNGTGPSFGIRLYTFSDAATAKSNFLSVVNIFNDYSGSKTPSEPTTIAVSNSQAVTQITTGASGPSIYTLYAQHDTYITEVHILSFPENPAKISTEQAKAYMKKITEMAYQRL